MSDLDTLIVTFQTQLSDVMESVVKTAMYEVTRLVEDGFLEEVKRRNQEVETLRMQLQWAENKLSDQDDKERKVRRCADCARDDVDTPAAGEWPKEQQDGMKTELDVEHQLRILVMKSVFLVTGILKEGCAQTEGASAERWARSCRREIPPASPQTVTFSPERISQVGLVSQQNDRQ